ncbi:Uncharacterised protein [Mycobacterium tuberculosis]|nr:Uncharacterised protein [Mycobacterium tuberculosis]
MRTVTCWPGSNRNASRNASGTAKVTRVASAVMGSTDATGMRCSTACGELERAGIRTGSSRASRPLSSFHCRYSSGFSCWPKTVEIAALRSRYASSLRRQVRRYR